MRRLRPACLVATLAFAVVNSASAQQAQAWADSAARLQSVMSAVTDSLRHGDSTTVDVGRRGDLVIAASASERAPAAEALQQLAAVRDHWFGGAMPAPGGFKIVIHTTDEGFSWLNPGKGSVIVTGLPDTGRAFVDVAAATSARIGDVLIDRFGRLMYDSVPALMAWEGEPPPLSTPVDEREDRTMYAFVTAMSEDTRRCVGGDIGACEAATGLRHTPGENEGAEFGTYVRDELLLYALELGGPGAWPRFRATASQGMGPALSAAAERPIDSVLTAWRRHLLERRPTTAPLTIRSALLAAAWTLIFAGGAFGAARWD